VIWAIPQAHSLVVIREDVETEVSTDVFFTSDRVAVKTTMRVGWGLASPRRGREDQCVRGQLESSPHAGISMVTGQSIARVGCRRARSLGRSL
jgi:hypothetical protein